ncbi:MAG: CpsB/CapC family capsule biosynthesis tyrosine phosphatase [Myxococcota bacterium]
MTGYVDLHCHYLPGIDDGVRTHTEGVQLIQRLRDIGYRRVVATPHIRSAMFENTRAGLERAFREFSDAVSDRSDLPELGLGAEHFFDDAFWRLHQTNETVPYPGGHAVLIEFSRRSLPVRLAERLFDIQVKGIRPVLAHPERYAPLFRKSDELEPLVEGGSLPLLDLMSLSGKYGRRPKKAAERILKEGFYYAACSDCHRPEDVDLVAEAIRRLRKLVGDHEAESLLRERPQAILEGQIDW